MSEFMFHAFIFGTKRLAEMFSDTLLTLGGPLNYESSAHTAEELLQHTPQCPPTTAITPTPSK